MDEEAASHTLLDTAGAIVNTSRASRLVLVQKENFKKLTAFMEKIAIVLQELSKFESTNHECMNIALKNVETEIKFTNHLALECGNGNRMHLFLCCKRIVEDLESCTKNIGRAMIVFTSGSSNAPPETKDDLMNLCNNMLDEKYEISKLEEQILQKIEKGIEERNNDPSYASDLLVSIAQALGISTNNNAIKKEFENFKGVIETMESGTEASRLEQIVLLLSNANIIMTPKEKEIKYFTKRNSLGQKLLEPLSSFYCPITCDVMKDPVETPSGHTFERSAITKWLEEGNNFCPLTKMPLSKSSLRSNRTLWQSIEEWKNRNIMISIACMKPEIQSEDEEEVLCSIRKIRDLCERSEVHREWVVMEDYVPIISGLVGAKNGELRVLALAVLYYLAKDTDDNKEKIAKVKDSIMYIVCSLARKLEESVLALQLLLELSRSVPVRSLIGCAQGCILLLVTLTNSDDPQASVYAHEVLHNLAFIDENVTLMAKLKFFEPLLHYLCRGPVSLQITMAETLASIELTDHNKLSLSKQGTLKPLLDMLQLNNTDAKSAAVKALQNLSTIPQNGLWLIKKGAKDTLFNLLFCHSLPSVSKLRENVVKVIMHLAASTTCPEALDQKILLMESEDDVFKLFSLILYSEPGMQEALLITFCALCGSYGGLSIRTSLRQISAVKVLVQLCELQDYLASVRKNAVKLLYHLTLDGDHETFTDHMNKNHITTLLKIMKSSNDENETCAAMGLISRLPQIPQMSQALFESGAVEAILDCLTFKHKHPSHQNEVLEHASKALCRFTDPSDIEQQKKVAKICTIPFLVKLLLVGSPPTIRNICISLKQFSQNSSSLTSPVKRSSFLVCCLGSSGEKVCPIHAGVCGVNSSFCLLEAGAVEPLVAVLGENDDETREASLDAILTLIEGVLLQNGCKVLEEVGGITAIIKMLGSAPGSLQEKALGALYQIFTLVEFKLKYGRSAQTLLVDITQRGSRDAKSAAAKILAQLNVLNEQSSFF